ncbi:MAG: hypothetical protein AAB539_01575 [Patescibacteria group bacterium]
MNTITIPRHIASKGDLVLIPKKEYDVLLQHAYIKEFSPTASQKRALARAERNFEKGETLSYHELARKLGFTR